MTRVGGRGYALLGQRIISCSDLNLRNDNPLHRIVFASGWTWCSFWEPKPPTKTSDWQRLGLVSSDMRPGTDQALSKCMLNVTTANGSGCSPPKIRTQGRRSEPQSGEPTWILCLISGLAAFKVTLSFHMYLSLVTSSLTCAALSMGMVLWFYKSLAMLNTLISCWPVLLLKPASTTSA